MDKDSLAAALITAICLRPSFPSRRLPDEEEGRKREGNRRQAKVNRREEEAVGQDGEDVSAGGLVHGL